MKEVSFFLKTHTSSNREYENRLQDEKRQINILLPKYLGVFEEEFRSLIRR